MSASKLISILVPVYNTKPNLLIDMIESVIHQTSDQWELCLVNDGSKAPLVDCIIKYYRDKINIEQGKSKIKYFNLDFNHGIAIASNVCLSMAEGDFCGLLDHDDCLEHTAVEKVMALFNGSEEIDLVYTDEDQIDEKGECSNPIYKTDFGLESVLHWMFLNHFLVIRTDILKKIGGFSIYSNRCPDNDLVYKILERTNKVHHLKEILYHWRLTETSSSMKTNKTAIIEDSLSGLNRYLSRNGKSATASQPDSAVKYNVGFFQTSLKKIEEEHISNLRKNTNIVILHNGNSTDLMRMTQYFYTFFKMKVYAVISYKKVLCDLQSTVSEYYDILNEEATTIAQIINSSGKPFTLIMSDLLFFKNHDWVKEILYWKNQHGVAAVTGKLLKNEQLLDSAGLTVQSDFPYFLKILNSSNTDTVLYHHCANRTRNISIASKDLIFLSNDCIKEIGGIRHSLFPNEYYISDLCLRFIQSNYRIVYSPYIQAQYLDSNIFTRETEKLFHEGELFFSEWQKFVDPYFPNINMNSNHNSQTMTSKKQYSILNSCGASLT